MNGESKPMIAETESENESAQRDKRELLRLALEEFCARTDAGDEVHREAFLRKYALVADELDECFVSLDFVQHIAPQLADEEPRDADESPTIRAKANLGDFRILRQLGRGGMGVVFEAEQLSLGRIVALKVLPFASMLDEKQLQRFKNEARAAATLDHPNIISVYGTGQDRGVHYYAMQLIHGQNIAQVIDDLRRTAGPREARETCDPVSPAGDTQPQAALSTERFNNPAEFFRSIAKLGMQAAEALDHAHAQAIVHRDVKPANLMLDNRGKLYVTDFGLARIETDAGVTMTGDLVGTLRYMSPEQALAKRVVVDHRTDIYSLGVTLYELLTLKPAFAGDNRQQLLHNISFEEPKPPRSINRAIPTELDTIVRKTIEKNPGDRYATALELADDLRRFLQDKPIHAKPPSLWQKIAKWSRRHKPIVVSAAVVLVLATIGLAIGSLLLARQRNMAESARASEQHQRKEAERQRELAEKNFRLAFDAVDQMLAQVASSELVDVPRAEPVRQALLEKALEFYEGFLAERGSDPEVRRDAARAHLRTAEVRALLNQHETAEKAYRQAIAMFEQLVVDDHGQPEYQHHLADAHHQLGTLLGSLGRLAEQGESLRKAVAIEKKLVEEFSGEEKYANVLALCYTSLAACSLSHGQVDQAAALYQQGQSTLQGEKDTPSPDQAIRATLRQGTGNVQVTTGRLQEAEQTYNQSRQIWETLHRQFPLKVEYREQLAGCLHELSIVLYEQRSDVVALRGKSKRELCIEVVRESIEIKRKLVSDFPNVPHYRYGLAKSLNVLTLALTVASSAGEACQNECLEIYQQLEKDYPDVPDYSSGLASILHNVGIRHATRGDFEEAGQCYRESIRINQQLDTRFSNVPKYQDKIALSEMCIGLMGLLGWPRLNDAEQALRQSLDKYRVLSQQFPQNMPFRAQIPECLGYLGDLLRGTNRLKEAAAAYRESLALFEQILTEIPTHLSSLEWHNEYVSKLAEVLLRLDQVETTEELFREQLSQWSSLHSARQDKSQCLVPLVNLHQRFGQWLREIGRDGDAKAQFALAQSAAQEAIALARQAIELDASDRSALLVWNRMALFFYRSGSLENVDAEIRPVLDLAKSQIDLADRDLQLQYHTAPVLLLIDRADDYRNLCTRLLDELDGQSDEIRRRFDNRVVRMCGLDPAAAGDPDRVLRLAKSGIVSPDDQRAVYRYALGRAHYRAGDYEQAIEWLQKAMEKDSRQPLICLDMAIANHLAQRPDDATDWLDKATQLRKQWPDEDIRGLEAMETEVLLREAQRLIRGDSPAANQELKSDEKGVGHDLP